MCIVSGTDVDADGVEVIPPAAKQSDDAAAVLHRDAERGPVDIPERAMFPEVGDEGQGRHSISGLRADVGECPRDFCQELRWLETKLCDIMHQNYTIDNISKMI